MATAQSTGFDRCNEFTAMVRIEVHFEFRGDWYDHRRDSWFDRTVRCRGQGSHLASRQPPHPSAPRGRASSSHPPWSQPTIKITPHTHHVGEHVPSHHPTCVEICARALSTSPNLLLFCSLPAVYSRF